MTLPQNVKDAVKLLDYTSVPLTTENNLRAWQTIRAHLLSQEAEIERLQTGLSNHVDRVCELQSRLAAANALLRFMRTRFDAYMDDSDRASIDAHLSENTHDRA